MIVKGREKFVLWTNFFLNSLTCYTFAIKILKRTDCSLILQHILFNSTFSSILSLLFVTISRILLVIYLGQFLILNFHSSFIPRNIKVILFVFQFQNIKILKFVSCWMLYHNLFFFFQSDFFFFFNSKSRSRECSLSNNLKDIG